MSVSAVTALLVTTFVGGPAEVRDRLIVLGLHHSGTSIVAKALDGLGFYLGDAKDLLLHPDNPLKYWERRDARRLASCGDQSITGKLKHGMAEVSDEAHAAPLIAAVLSVAAVLLLGLSIFTYRMLKVWHRMRPTIVGAVTARHDTSRSSVPLQRHKQMYATLQQQLQASQELSALTRTVNDDDLGMDAEPPELTPDPVESRVLRVLAVTKTTSRE